MRKDELLHAMGTKLVMHVVGNRVPPDFIIGGADNPYLRRWFVRPEGASGGMYLHQILRDDDDRALHDHPWDSSVYIIHGAYEEVLTTGRTVYRAGSYRHMPAEQAHRLVVVEGPVWTLCFLGPRKREWGFHCPQGWVPWQQFVSGRDKGQIGAGCGDANP